MWKEDRPGGKVLCQSSTQWLEVYFCISSCMCLGVMFLEPHLRKTNFPGSIELVLIFPALLPLANVIPDSPNSISSGMGLTLSLFTHEPKTRALPGTHQGWWLMMNSEHSPLE
jgi:hypothetical protein